MGLYKDRLKDLMAQRAALLQLLDHEIPIDRNDELILSEICKSGDINENLTIFFYRGGICTAVETT